jgi:hypothetical protein
LSGQTLDITATLANLPLRLGNLGRDALEARAGMSQQTGVASWPFLGQSKKAMSAF